MSHTHKQKLMKEPFMGNVFKNGPSKICERQLLRQSCFFRFLGQKGLFNRPKTCLFTFYKKLMPVIFLIFLHEITIA